MSKKQAPPQSSLDDQPFRHYSMKRRVVAWISQTLFDNVSYTVHNGLLKGMRRRGGLGWLPEFLVRSTRTPEISFWMNQDLSNLVVYDIGAFHGLLTLFFARRARQVVSYEPNTRNHARLIENLRLNETQNVLVRKVGIGSRTEIASMVTSPLMPGGARVEDHAAPALVHSDRLVLTEQIPITTLDDDIREMSLPPPDIIKVDIEGQELALLVGARNTLIAHHPILVLEMHGATMNIKRKNVAAIVTYLNDLGYKEIWHVESGSNIGPETATVAAEGHLYCR